MKGSAAKRAKKRPPAAFSVCSASVSPLASGFARASASDFQISAGAEDAVQLLDDKRSEVGRRPFERVIDLNHLDRQEAFCRRASSSTSAWTAACC